MMVTMMGVLAILPGAPSRRMKAVAPGHCGNGSVCLCSHQTLAVDGAFGIQDEWLGYEVCVQLFVMCMPGLGRMGEGFICPHFVVMFMPANGDVSISYNVNEGEPVTVHLPPFLNQ